MRVHEILGKQIAAQSQTKSWMKVPEKLKSTGIPKIKFPDKKPTKHTRQAGRWGNKHPFT